MGENKYKKEIISSNIEGASAEDIKEPYKTFFLQAVLEAVLNYFGDPVHEKEFQEWYLKEYGVPYVPEIKKNIYEMEDV